MVTEKGTIVSSTKIDEGVQYELNKKVSIISIVALILGAVGVVAFFALYVVMLIKDNDTSLFIAFLMLFAVILGCGVGLLLLVKKQLASFKGKDYENKYEFYKNYFIVNQYSKGERVAVVKNYISQIVKAKETDKYLFFYISTAAAYPVAKSDLTDGELNALRKMFSLPTTGEGIEIPDIDSETLESHSGNPFSDFDRK